MACGLQLKCLELKEGLEGREWGKMGRQKKEKRRGKILRERGRKCLTFIRINSFFDPLGITNLPLWQDLCVPDIPGAMLSSFALIGTPNENLSLVRSKTKSN